MIFIRIMTIKFIKSDMVKSHEPKAQTWLNEPFRIYKYELEEIKKKIYY